MEPLQPQLSIASLVRRRGAGELSRDDFFACLAELQAFGGGGSTGSRQYPPAALAAPESRSAPSSPAGAWCGGHVVAEAMPQRALFTPQPRRGHSSQQSSFSTRRSETSLDCFASRNELWDLQRSRRRQELKRQQEAKELSECSFHPSGGVSRTRGGAAPGLSPRSASVLAERLAQPSNAAPRLSQRLEEWRQQREAESHSECTFKPNLSQSSRSFQQAPRTPDRMTRARKACESSQVSEFSAQSEFVPATNPVPPSMRSAHAYLQEDVFSRLSRPPPCTPDRHEVAEERRRHSASSPWPLSRSCSEPSIGVDSSMLCFLQRQNLCEEARQQRLQSIEASTAPSLRPALCQRSLQLVTRSQRRAADAADATPAVRSCPERPQTAPGRTSASPPPKPARPRTATERECTFAPKITSLARQREPRSFSELGPGDQRRREKRARQRREVTEKQEASRYSFKPEVRSYQGIGSRLRVLEDPDTLLERMARSREAAMRNARNAKKVEEYPFHPEGVKPAPELVRRMAESHRALRELREKENSQNNSKAKPRPAWQ
eukprot:gb/GFBE01078393.1/.p1 GENE.gb/GFBE01078393.1/~~gb/GFBE01078393.1/.p1  ORF type:complete len:550 (+),score=73.97 gb/GFBE01078393.1/:1-1650(+)